ncbi:MAG: YceD family protein [Desulfomonilia bacterium]
MEKIRTLGEIKITPETIGEAGMERDVSIGPEVMLKTLDDDDLKITDPFQIHYEVTKFIERVHVSVDVEGTIHTFCSRCLSPISYPVDLHLDTEYLPAAADMPEHLEAERQTSEVGYYRKEIELGEYIGSELVLSLPIIYLCSQTCKGLCPTCGANLNEAPCACTRQGDPGFQKLAELKNKIRR